MKFCFSPHRLEGCWGQSTGQPYHSVPEAEKCSALPTGPASSLAVLGFELSSCSNTASSLYIKLILFAFWYFVCHFIHADCATDYRTWFTGTWLYKTHLEQHVTSCIVHKYSLRHWTLNTNSGVCWTHTVHFTLALNTM